MQQDEYQIYTNSPISHWMFGLLSNHGTGRDLRLASKNIAIRSEASDRRNYKEYIYENDDLIAELIIEEINKKLPLASQLSLIYVFIVGNHQNWKDNKATFKIEDYIAFKGEEVNKVTRESARRQLDQVMKRLLDCKISVKYNRKTKRSFNMNVLGSYTYNNGYCTVEFPSVVTEALNIYPQLFPTWAGKLSNQKAFAIIIYIYYRIKQAKVHNGTINLNIKDLLSYAGLPYERDQVQNRRHKQLIMTPFLKAIDDIHLVSDKSLKIDNLDYKGIDDFLNGYVVVKYDDTVADYYKGVATNGPQRKKRIPKGTTN